MLTYADVCRVDETERASLSSQIDVLNMQFAACKDQVLRQHTSAYVSIRQHTSAYVSEIDVLNMKLAASKDQVLDLHRRQ
jgi:hypothetical protein